MFLATENGHLDTLKLLLEAGFPVDIRNVCEDTPLLNFAKKPNSVSKAGINLLLKNGADIQAVDSHGRNAIHLLARGYDQPENRLDVLKFLIRAGCRVEQQMFNPHAGLGVLGARDPTGSTPAHWILSKRITVGYSKQTVGKNVFTWYRLKFLETLIQSKNEALRTESELIQIELRRVKVPGSYITTGGLPDDICRLIAQMCIERNIKSILNIIDHRGHTPLSFLRNCEDLYGPEKDAIIALLEKHS